MTWRPPPRTPEAEAIHAAAEASRAEDPAPYELAGAAGELVDRARRDQPVAALGEPDEWRTGLEHYLESAAAEARLNALGARMARETATGRLRARLALARLASQRPDLADRPLAPPLVITGGWRTGTTYLFRALAQDPRLRAPLPAELTAPWRFVGLDPEDRARRIEASAATHDLLHALNPTMAAVHDSGAWLPEECVLAMGTDLRNWGFASTVRLPSYVAWLATQDLTTSYATYAWILRALDAGDDRRWLLKAPAHTAELPALARALPGACVVHLHRDPVETVASGASLFATFRSTYSDHVDPTDLGASMLDQTELWLRRAEGFRASPESTGVTVLDLSYEQLVTEPEVAFARVYAAAGMDLPPDLPGMLEAYDAAHPRGAHGVHRYSAADFGIDPVEVRERLGPLDRRDG